MVLVFRYAVMGNCLSSNAMMETLLMAMDVIAPVKFKIFINASLEAQHKGVFVVSMAF